jgi:hypothetical protein
MWWRGATNGSCAVSPAVPHACAFKFHSAVDRISLLRTLRTLFLAADGFQVGSTTPGVSGTIAIGRMT